MPMLIGLSLAVTAVTHGSSDVIATWILSTGFWVDDSLWVDSATWND